MAGLMDKLVGDRSGKARWHEYGARVAALPTGYREAAEAMERYLLRAGVVRDGDVLVNMHEEMVGAFEDAARAGMPVSDVVAGDPVGYAHGLLAKYAAGDALDDERRELVQAFNRAQEGRPV